MNDKEIKVGEYIRTNRIERTVDKFYNENILHYRTDRGFCPTEDVIKKHSFNIIDLIEPGDVINYYSNYSGNEIKMEVDYIRCKKDDYKWGLGYVSTHYDDYVYIENIKSIVTKEQFANEGYKVEE